MGWHALGAELAVWGHTEMQTVFWTEGLRGEVRPGERGVSSLKRAVLGLWDREGQRQGFFRGGRGNEGVVPGAARPVGAARVEGRGQSALHGPGGGRRGGGSHRRRARAQTRRAGAARAPWHLPAPFQEGRAEELERRLGTAQRPRHPQPGQVQGHPGPWVQTASPEPELLLEPVER